MSGEGGGGLCFLPTADARALYIGIRDSIYGGGKALYPLTRLMELKFNNYWNHVHVLRNEEWST